MGHLTALLKKNFLLWRRGGCCSVLEILFPLAFCFFFYLFRTLIKEEDVSAQSYLERDLQKKQIYPVPVYSDFPTQFQSSSLQEKRSLGAMMKDCLDNKKDGNPFRVGYVVMAPKNFITEELEKRFANYGYQSQFFDSRQEIFRTQTHENYKENFCLGITVDSLGENNKWHYRIHYNSTSLGGGNDVEIPSTLNEEYVSYKISEIDNNIEKWLKSGFSTIQNWIDNIILQQQTTNANQINAFVTSMRVEKHVDDKLPQVLRGQMNTYTILPLIIIFLRFLYQILQEKENKIRESMKIMGLSDISFYLSWIIHYGIVYTFVALLTAIICKSSIFPSSDFFLIFVWYWLYCMNCLFLALAVSTFFTKAKVGNICGMVIYLGFYILNFVLAGNTSLPVETKTAYAMLPQISVSLGADVFALIENKGKGIDWSNYDLLVENFSVARSLNTMFLSCIILIIIFLYCDQVIPNEFGTKRHPLFCFPCLFKRNKKLSKQHDIEDDHKQDMENIEPVEGVLKEKAAKGDALELHDLSKTYGNGKKAVRNMNLTMYKDHISCLLGHNGAGKTTTISMLTGMIGITKGSASVFGFDVQKDMGDLRKVMGLCPQHDILFPNLTVEEHLQIFAEFKGMTDKAKIREQVEQMLDDVDLQKKRKEYSKSLSGGQKRRLSVAMAFIGGSKLIYLDEPTSGCDTSVRRFIWDMLRRYKQDKIVILTTHFMDEADYLGDRISIIGDGKLICSGSSNFLKTKFGVGYNLTIVKNDTNVSSEPFTELVCRHIPEAKKVSDVSSELAFQLKMTYIDKFQAMFEELDAKKRELKYANYGISITTMEEVFLKVAQSDAEQVAQEGAHLLKQSTLKNASAVVREGAVDNFDLNKVRIKGKFELFLIHFWALIKKKIWYFKRDKKGIFCEMVIPCAMVVLALWAMTVDTFKESPALTFSPEDYGKKQPVLYSGAAGVVDTDMKAITDQFPSDYFSFTQFSSTDKEQWDLENFNKRGEKRRGAFYFESISNTAVSYLMEVASLNRDAVPVYMNQMNQAILRKMTGKSDLTLTVTQQAWHFTAKHDSLQNSDKGISAAFSFAMLLSFVPASIITFVVKERAEQIKHQQIVSGVSLEAYWLSSFALDYIKFIFPLACWCIAMVFAFQISFYTDDGAVFSALVILFLLYGFSIIPFTYMFSFLFKSPGNAQVLSFFLHYLMGGMVPLIIWLLKVFIEDAKTYAEAIQWILRVLPSFSFGYALINIASRETYMQLDDDITELQSPYHMDIAGADMLYMFFTAFASLALIALFEFMKSKGTIDKLIAKQSGCPQYTQKYYDDDVERERQIVNKSSKDDYVIRLNKVRKVFKTNTKYLEAVDSVSVGIKNGECFTLLGINGAGKTTLFKILSGDHICTGGEAHINGYDVSTEMSVARYNIGYCPQFDALLENLTAREHLELYAAIKGIPKNMREEIVKKKIAEMDLTKYENVIAGTYSGGNKRKLSVAIAMMGNPPVVLLDEPSTGMDPKARRFMWDVISRISTQRKSSSIVLTTHSMEEAEALSTKMVIMVEGNFKCLGSIQHIKSKFGQGYELEVKVNLPSQEVYKKHIENTDLKIEQVIRPNEIGGVMQALGWAQYANIIAPNMPGQELYNSLHSQKGLGLQNLLEFFILEIETEQVNQFLAKTFGKFSIIEHFSSFTRYKIETENAIGKIFGEFQKTKQQLNIASYSVKQATIEAIFNQFATNKINTEDFNKGGKFYKNFENEMDDQPVQPTNKNLKQQLKEDQEEEEYNGVKPEQIKIGSQSGLLHD